MSWENKIPTSLHSVMGTSQKLTIFQTRKIRFIGDFLQSTKKPIY